MSDTLYENGVKAYNENRYTDALEFFQQSAASGNAYAESYIPLTYFCLASNTSQLASKSQDTETLVKGQQQAVKLCDLAIRSALNFIHKYPEDISNCAASGMVISRAFSLQYALVATGLTVAYRLTGTTRTIERTMLNGVTLWEEIVGEETYSTVSLTSWDMHDYHIIGDDERTKRIEENKERILANAVQAATILGYMGREYDALLVRAVIAAEMADCENGIRSMLLAADWFVAMAMQVGIQEMEEAAYNEWNEFNETTFTEIAEYQQKYGAVLRKLRREGMRPYLNRFYQDPNEVPKIEDCVIYMQYQAQNAEQEQKAVKGDGFAAFLTVFAQAANQKVIPVVVFASTIGLLFGGFFRLFNPDTGIIGKALIAVFAVLTLLLTLVRSGHDASNMTGSTRRMFMLIRFGIAFLIAVNFWIGMIAFIVLKVLSKPYK